MALKLKDTKGKVSILRRVDIKKANEILKELNNE